MGNLTVETTRYIDLYQVQDKYGNNYTQANILSVIDANGNLTDAVVKADKLTDDQKSAMVANGIKFDNYGNAYYETENLSRFIHYGVDSNGTLYAFNYAGDKMKIASDGSFLDPATGTKADAETTGNFLSQIKATYDISWNGVSPTGLSLSRVIMLVTLIRAELIEEQLVEQMDKLATRTAQLIASADAEQIILNNSHVCNNTQFYYYHGISTTSSGSGNAFTTLGPYLTNSKGLGLSVTLPADDNEVWSSTLKEQIISAIQTKQDELNTISQETSINIQSLINKRDQSYLLGTNAISLFYSGHISVARNI